MISVSAQEQITKQAEYFRKTIPLRDMEIILPQERVRSFEEVDNEFNLKTLLESRENLPTEAVQINYAQRSQNDILTVFEGVGNENNVYPPDPNGDVSNDHYFQIVNLSFAIYTKDGTRIYGPVDNSTLWDGFVGPWTGTNDGDPLAVYDELADRWVISQFAINTGGGGYWQLIAVSETSDPLGSYYQYAYQFPALNDYPKMGVWPDGYYFSFNLFGSYSRACAAVVERDLMLVGDPNARIVIFDLPNGSDPSSFLPSDIDGTAPPLGAPNYFMYVNDNAWGYPTDHVRVWEFHVDWNNTVNSTFVLSQSIDVASFSSNLCIATRERCIEQPNTTVKLEAITDRLMNRLQYVNFGIHETMVTNHTVNVGGLAAVRWYEFRNTGSGWFIYQQGTYAPNDGLNRWMGSAAINMNGDIAIGYTTSSLASFPSIRCVGRIVSDQLGIMTTDEEIIQQGSGSQTGSSARWGDYSMMTVDPSNGTNFWFTHEYIQTTGYAPWKTKIVEFTLSPDDIQQTKWIGTTRDWHTSSNWTNGIPNSSLSVLIQSGYEYPLISNNNAESNNLIIQQNMTVDIDNSSLTVHGELNIDADNGLHIKPLADITVLGNTSLNGENALVIESSNIGQGSFIDNGTITYTTGSSAKVETWISNSNTPGTYYFHQVGSSVSDEVFEFEYGLSGVYLQAFDLALHGTYAYVYDESTDSWVNVWPYETPISATTGLILSTTDQTDWKVILTGQLLTNNIASSGITFVQDGVPIDIGYFTNNLNGYNLISNPYPSSIDFNMFYNDNPVDNTIYIWSQSDGNYATYTVGTGGTLGATNLIQLGQAFFVQANTAAPSILFENSYRTHSNSIFFSPTYTHNEIRVKMSGNGYNDEILLLLDRDGTEYNVDKWYGTANSSNIWFKNEQAVISKLLLNENTEFPVYFKCGEENMHFIEISLQNFSFVQEFSVYLYDKQLDIEQNIKHDSIYSFIGSPDDEYDRFLLKLQLTTTNIGSYDENNVKLWSFGKHINLEGENDGNMKVYDIAGRKIGEYSKKRVYIQQTGIYIVSYTVKNKKYSKKLIIH